MSKQKKTPTNEELIEEAIDEICCIEIHDEWGRNPDSIEQLTEVLEKLIKDSRMNIKWWDL